MKTAANEKCPNIDQKDSQFSAVVVAAGKGRRAGQSLPKQYLSFGGKPVFLHAVETFLNHRCCVEVALVHPENEAEHVHKLLQQLETAGFAKLVLVEGGAERAESVRKGLAAIQSERSQHFMVHDAARPGVSGEVIDNLQDALHKHEGAAPALPIVDALKFWDKASVRSVSRSDLYRIQTPQAFRMSKKQELTASSDHAAFDEFELAEKLGFDLTLTEGSEQLSKLTYPQDFKRLERLLFDWETRTGLGYDVHAFEDGEQVFLCGIEIPHEKKLNGHSDADVGWHALTDAILGALADGDIGDHFPPTDPQWKGAPSDVFLRFAADRVRSRGGKILHLDVTLICEAPKIKPHRDAMRYKTAQIVGVDADRVSVKATTTEGLGFEGRREGISAQAIATISLPSKSRLTDKAE